MDLSFYLTRQEAGKPTAVYAHIRYSKQKFKYYLDQKIDPEFWNSKEQRAKKTNRFPGNMEFNRRLSYLYNKIKDLYSAYRNDHDGQDPTPEEFRIMIDQEMKGKQRQTTKAFVAFMKDLKDTAKSGLRVQPRTGKPFSKSTVDAYHITVVHLEAFEQTQKRKLEFEDITVEFHADFTEFLIKKYKYKPNSIGRDIRILKMAMNEAMERGLHTNFQYKSKRFSAARDSSVAIYLTLSEIQALLDIDLSETPSLEKVRDLFVVGCFTGLRYSDLSTLTAAQVKDGYITITQKKTSHEIVIPVHPVVKQMIEKYQGNLPKPFSTSHANFKLKEIGQRCAALDVLVSKAFTKGGIKLSKNFHKWEMLTTHTARRSFATNEYLAGTGTETIMAITGHKSSTSFKSYIRLTPTEHAQKMKDIWDTRNQLKAI